MLPEGCDDAPVVGDDGWYSLLLRLTDLRDGRPVRIELDGSGRAPRPERRRAVRDREPPATDPVPAYETRAIDGVVEIRAR